MIPRLHLVELEDLPWFPAVVRNAGTGYLQLAIDVGAPYAPVAPLLARAIRDSGTQRIVDLCSGGGGPWRRLRDQLAAEGADPPVLLTDKYPNPGAIQAVRDGGANDAVTLYPDSVDATRVPESLGGFRTMFSAFHHFGPADARAVLAGAVRDGAPIAIFEATKRSLPCLLFMLLTPIMVLLMMPRVRPFRWSNLFFTYVVPLVPLMVLWDGVVSCLRTYDARELRALVASVPRSDRYHWHVGEIALNGPIPVTYLIGLPNG